MSSAAAVWRECLRHLGHEVTLVAGEGDVDRTLPWLSPGHADVAADPDELTEVLADTDVVVAENLLTIPLHLAASRAVAGALRGRPAIIRHFDPPWQRERFAHVRELPVDDPAWIHVTPTIHTQKQFADRGFDSRLIYPAVAPPQRVLTRDEARLLLGLPPAPLLCLHPVRAVERKNMSGAIEIARSLGATYWLTGAAEESYQDEARRLLADAGIPSIWRPVSADLLDAAYAAADLVVYPSHWEGFGLPPLEAAIRRRPVAVGDYPAAAELRGIGFDWPRATGRQWRSLLRDPPRLAELIETNESIAQADFSLGRLRLELADLLEDVLRQ